MDMNREEWFELANEHLKT